MIGEQEAARASADRDRSCWYVGIMNGGMGPAILTRCDSMRSLWLHEFYA